MNDVPSKAEEVEKLKRKFIEDALLPLVLEDCLSQDWHGEEKVRLVFKKAPTVETQKEYEQKRQAFRQALTLELRNLARNYEGLDVLDETHIQTIRDMADRLGAVHRDILNGGILVFGVAHKALNVYLKYLWCANLNIRPPHCPFDYDLISSLKPGSGVEYRWTHADKEDDYHEWVRLAKAAAERGGYSSLSAWEVAAWDAIQKKKREQEERAEAKKKANEPSNSGA
jgi:hypothetical protein